MVKNQDSLFMMKKSTNLYPEEGKLCMGCFHQRFNHRYNVGKQNNSLLCAHPKCNCIQFVEWI